MTVKTISFAEGIEGRLRARWPKATVTYVGGGWFNVRIDPMLPGLKTRREELRRKAQAVELATASTNQGARP